MKLIVLASVIGACAAGLLPSNYLPPNAQASGGYSYSQGASQAYTGAAQTYTGAARPRAALERNAAILRSNADLGEQGFQYSFETENGIQAEETGHEADGIQAQGGYSYTGDDGQVYSVRYSADRNGFQAQGAHLPTPPPVPQEILKALEDNARDEASGIFDDGTYNEAKYGGSANNFDSSVAVARTSFQAAQSAPSRQYLAPNTRSGYHY